MKTNMLKTVLFLFLGTTFLTSCSKDDESEPTNPENPSATFDAGIFTEDVTLPEAISSSNDPKAQELVYEFEQVTYFQSFSEIMTVPPGATMSHEPVQTGNGRPAGIVAATDYTVYTYTYGEMTMIYQFSVQNGYDVFELFYDFGDEMGIVKYFEIQQSLDGTHGTMSYFGEVDGNSEGFWNWEWNVQPSGTISVTMNMFGIYVYEMLLNPDNSGTLDIYNSGILYMEYQWTATGSGTWTNHADNTSGSWQ